MTKEGVFSTCYALFGYQQSGNWFQSLEVLVNTFGKGYLSHVVLQQHLQQPHQQQQKQQQQQHAVTSAGYNMQ